MGLILKSKLCLSLWLALVVYFRADAQPGIEPVAASGDLQFILTTGDGQLKLNTDQARASYDESLAIIKVTVILDDFQPDMNGSVDYHLLSAFRRTNKLQHLKMHIYLPERPVSLEDFDQSGSSLPIRVEIDQQLIIEGMSEFVGRHNRGDLFFKTSLVTKPDEPVSLFGLSPIHIDQLELYVTSATVLSFFDF